MHCKKVKKLLEAYVESELDESERESLKAHISNCEMCRRELGLAQWVPGLISRLSTPYIPEDIIPNTLRQLHEAPKVRWPERFGTFKWPVVVSASLLIVALLFAVSYHIMNVNPEITPGEAASAAAEARFALGIVVAGTQHIQNTVLSEGVSALDTARSISRDTIRNVSEAQLEAMEKLKDQLDFLIQLQPEEVENHES